jgi:alkanesulfonate monooxygenase SsuD/methylene tetrahydromethanopterin reductase-like flavin-dependent oxidoreductase (luciferase family)
VRFAVGVPNLREYADAALLRDIAVDAEAAGWDGFFVWDHLVGDDPAWPATDPWIALTAATVATERVVLGVMVTPLARRRPWKVARETVALDRLSGGRLRFGVGLGGAAEQEFTAFGESSDARVRADRIDEGLELLLALWSGEPVRHDGAHYRVEAPAFAPVPLQRPRIPVWVAGVWPNRRPFRRAARYDGVFPLFDGVGEAETPGPEPLAECVAYVRAHRTGDAPFDVIIEGTSAPGRDERLAPLHAAGLTWWIEKLGWFRGPLEAMRERVRAGPPR